MTILCCSILWVKQFFSENKYEYTFGVDNYSHPNNHLSSDNSKCSRIISIPINMSGK